MVCWRRRRKVSTWSPFSRNIQSEDAIQYLKIPPSFNVLLLISWLNSLHLWFPTHHAPTTNTSFIMLRLARPTKFLATLQIRLASTSTSSPPGPTFQSRTSPRDESTANQHPGYVSYDTQPQSTHFNEMPGVNAGIPSGSVFPYPYRKRRWKGRSEVTSG